MLKPEGKLLCLAYGYMDMRKSIDGLMASVEGNFKLDPFSEALLVFFNRSPGSAEDSGVGRGRLPAAFQAAGEGPLLLAASERGVHHDVERTRAGHPAGRS